MKVIKNLIAKVLPQKRTSKSRSVIFSTQEGCGFVGGPTITWEEITQIEAYKVDLFSVDSICIEIHTEEFSVSFCEEDEGYNNFVEAMELKLATEQDWFSKVSQPPFEESRTLIYNKILP